jgi:hypothetical protein
MAVATGILLTREDKGGSGGNNVVLRSGVGETRNLYFAYFLRVHSHIPFPSEYIYLF